MKQLFNNIYSFLKKYLCYISVAISLITFFIPIQITIRKTILGIDMVLLYKTDGWWGFGAPIAFFITAIFLAITIYYMVILIKHFLKSKKDSSILEISKQKRILFFGFTFSIVYFSFSILINSLCSDFLKPWTLSFIPLILQIPLFITYLLNKQNYIIEKPDNLVEKPENNKEEKAGKNIDSVALTTSKTTISKLKKETKFWWKIYLLLPKIAFFAIIGLFFVWGILDPVLFHAESYRGWEAPYGIMGIDSWFLCWFIWQIIGFISATLMYAIIKIHTSPIVLHVLSLEEKEKS